MKFQVYKNSDKLFPYMVFATYSEYPYGRVTSIHQWRWTAERRARKKANRQPTDSKNEAFVSEVAA